MPAKMFQAKAKVLNNKRVKEHYFHCALRLPEISRIVGPGQFVNIKTTEGLQPLLRRPLSIYRAKGVNIEILYEVVGKGTQLLSQKKSGEILDIIGPLGNGFNLRVTKLPVLVAGGIGVAPLLFLAERLVASKPLVLIGARTKDHILCEKELKKLGCSVKIATDDGSRGYKGKVTELLKHLLPTINYKLSTIYACGPKPMLRTIAEISKSRKIPAQISMEEHMACGIGACLGCVIKTKEGYKRVCKEGPVFDVKEVIWEGI